MEAKKAFQAIGEAMRCLAMSTKWSLGSNTTDSTRKYSNAMILYSMEQMNEMLPEGSHID